MILQKKCNKHFYVALSVLLFPPQNTRQTVFRMIGRQWPCAFPAACRAEFQAEISLDFQSSWSMNSGGFGKLGPGIFKGVCNQINPMKLKSKWADYQAPNSPTEHFLTTAFPLTLCLGIGVGLCPFLGNTRLCLPGLALHQCWLSCAEVQHGAEHLLCVCWLLMGRAAQSWASSHWLNIFGFVPNTMSILHEGRTRRLLRNASESTGGWSDVSLYHWATEPVSPIAWGGFSIYI